MLNKKIVIYLTIIMFSFLNKPMSENSKTFYDNKIDSINGEELNLSLFKGKTILLVNVASKCGFTKQYDDLQKLYEDYKISSNFLRILFDNGPVKDANVSSTLPFLFIKIL